MYYFEESTTTNLNNFIKDEEKNLKMDELLKEANEFVRTNFTSQGLWILVKWSKIQPEEQHELIKEIPVLMNELYEEFHQELWEEWVEEWEPDEELQTELDLIREEQGEDAYYNEYEEAKQFELDHHYQMNNPKYLFCLVIIQRLENYMNENQGW